MTVYAVRKKFEFFSSLTSLNFLSPQTKVILILLFSGTIACFMSLNSLPASHVDDQYLPIKPDSFYHARRILDLVNSNEFYQYDDKVLAPEGAQLSLPWGYPFIIGKFVSIAQNAFNISDPMKIVVYIPTLWVYVNTLLILCITISLRLPTPLQFLATLCFALSPLTQDLHATGRIDNHYMELTMVLLSVLAGLNWFKNPKSTRRAIALGAVLGLSPAIHNGLFILQLPFLATLFILWIRKQAIHPDAITRLAITLIACTLVILLPSEPFIKGMNKYYLLSWFHLYIACSSALIMLYLAKFHYQTNKLFLLIAICFVLAAIIATQILLGSQFLFSTLYTLEKMSETANILEQVATSGLYRITENYTGLIIIAPVALLALITRNIRNSHSQEIFLIVASLIGLTILTFQYRLHYFGSFALFLPLLVIFSRYVDDKNVSPVKGWTGLLAILVMSYLPVIKTLSQSMPIGGSVDYAATRHIYPSLEKVCNEDPGIILADHNDGHYIRFHSECSVIANNMLISQ